MIQLECTCGAKLKTRPANAGKKVRCPKCGGTIVAPTPSITPAEAQHRKLTAVRLSAYVLLFDAKPSITFAHRELGDSAEQGIYIDVYGFTLDTPHGEVVAAVTNGLSDRRMTDPNDPDNWARREIIQYFRTLTPEYAKRLRDMAWLPLFDKFLLDSYHSIAWNEEGTPWKDAFFLEPIIKPHQSFSVEVEGDPVTFLWHIPISEAERMYKKEHGSDALIDRMGEAELPWIFDESTRPPLVE
jgi:hypothetical protein